MTETHAHRQKLREALVREQMAAENNHHFDVALGSFKHPRYELVATGEIYDGTEAVRGYYAASRTAFPDQRNQIIAVHHADDSVIVEFDLEGTHEGPLLGFPATGRKFKCRLAAIFIFDGDRVACERVYFDSLTILAQLGLAPVPAAK